MLILNNIDGVEIPFDSKWYNVAISVSGGADSALLAHVICELAHQTHATPTVHIISHTRMWKTRPWQGYDSRRVFDYLSEKFTDLKFIRHANFIAPELEYGNTGPSLTDEYGKSVSGDNIQQRAYAEYICNQYNIEAYYNAVTHNPRDVDLGGMVERDVEPDKYNEHLVMMRHMDKWALHPLRFTDKSWVVRQYRKRDIMDLFEMTRSCEGEFDNITYENYRPGQWVPVCGTCFWCKERQWALEQE